MSQQLQLWCEKLKREVTEGTPVARRIRLMTAGEGTVWEQWEPVLELDPAQWASDAEQLISALLLELPKKRVQLIFVAEDNSGATIANLPRTVTGQNQNAQDLGTQNGAKALADAMAAVGKLSAATMEEAQKFMSFQAHQLEKLQEALVDAHEFFMAIRQAELNNTEQESAASQIMIEQVKQASPMLMTLLQSIIANAGNKSHGGVVAAATAATNGVNVS
jgi:hypothetical protein